MDTPIALDLITTGDELLLGIRLNAHLTHIGAELGRHGLYIRRNYSCSDEFDEIQALLGTAIDSGAEVIILTGGLGPTVDDNVREAVADYFDLALKQNLAVKDALVARFERMGITLTDNSFRQSYIPDGAEILPNPYGTAPGLYLRRDNLRIFLLPGPSSELKPMLTKHVIPRLCSDGFCNYGDAYLQLRCCGVGESILDSRMTPILADYSGIDVSYCAHQGFVDLRLSAKPGTKTDSEIREAADDCRIAMGEDFVCYGHDSLAKVVFDYLRAHELTLSVAESCTGGLLSNSFTDISGASKVFAGGCVCYNNDAKVQMLGVPESIIEQHGAVSAECAVAMADGIAERLDTDYALSITGFAGPSGGTPENPIGTIYIGYHSPSGSWCVKMVKPGNRAQVKERAVNRALDVMRRKLNKYCVADAFATMVVV